MPRRPSQTSPEKIRARLIQLLEHFEDQLRRGDLRKKVLLLVPAFHLLRDLGCSLIPCDGKSPMISAGRKRAYKQKFLIFCAAMSVILSRVKNFVMLQTIRLNGRVESANCERSRAGPF